MASPRVGFALSQPLPLLFLVLALALLGLAASPSAQTGETRTRLALVNEAGVLGPILRFDGVSWRTAEPPGASGANSANSAAPRATSDWLALPVDGQPKVGTRTIHVGGLVTYDAHCMKAVGLQSDLRDSAPPTPPNQFPQRTIALAVSNPSVRLEPLQRIDPYAAELRALRRAAETAFRAKMPATSSRAQVQWHAHRAWSYTLPADGAATAPPERVYLLEGGTNIARDPDRGPSINGFVWLRTRDGRLVERRASVAAFDEDGKFDRHHAPIGVVSIGARRFWFSVVYGYEHEEHQGIDITRAGFPLAVQVTFGGC